MAKGIARKTTDSAGGAITSGSPNVFVNGQPVARHGDTVASHGLGAHSAATLVSTARNFFVNGKRVVAAGDSATCGHTVTPGSGNVFVVS